MRSSSPLWFCIADPCPAFPLSRSPTRAAARRVAVSGQLFIIERNSHITPTPKNQDQFRLSSGLSGLFGPLFGWGVSGCGSGIGLYYVSRHSCSLADSPQALVGRKWVRVRFMCLYEQFVTSCLSPRSRNSFIPSTCMGLVQKSNPGAHENSCLILAASAKHRCSLSLRFWIKRAVLEVRNSEGLLHEPLLKPNCEARPEQVAEYGYHNRALWLIAKTLHGTKYPTRIQASVYQVIRHVYHQQRGHPQPGSRLLITPMS